MAVLHNQNYSNYIKMHHGRIVDWILCHLQCQGKTKQAVLYHCMNLILTDTHCVVKYSNAGKVLKL